jgi:arylsulfatase A-like enzyme
MKRITKNNIPHTLIKILILSVVLIFCGCDGGSSNQQNTSHPLVANPLEAHDDFFTSLQNTDRTFNVLENDAADDINLLTVTNVTAANHGTVIDNADGTLTYIPDTDYTGADTFDYTILDGHGYFDQASVTVQTIIPYNFVIILTDDQRFDSLWAMPIVQDKLVDQGVTFTNAYVPTPVCFPSRAGLILGGFYAHNTGMISSRPPNGDMESFHDTETLATLLQNVGYKTALVGKYLNRYQTMAPYVPPGWNKFVTKISGGVESFYVVEGSSGAEPAQGNIVGPIEEYVTDYLKTQALQFLDQHSNSSFFLLLSSYAPHYPAVPAVRDEYLFPNLIHRERAYLEDDLSDKPQWVKNRFSTHEDRFESIWEQDEFHRNQLRSLQAVDRAVGEIVEKIEEKGKLSQTVFFFTSDNGYLWGEHGLFGKILPYEESIRVPFVITIPGVEPEIDDHLVAVNLDIGPTLFDLAGIYDKKTDGLSLVPHLYKSKWTWREDLLIESFEPKWAGLLFKEGQKDWKYVEYATGEIELYDLLNDPYEEESRHNEPAYQDMISEKSARLAKIKGLNIITYQLPQGTVGAEYDFQLEAWGGTKPYNWSIVGGHLPEGLELDNFTGIISGVPIWAEEQQISIMVEDSSIATHTGLPQSYIKDFQIIIN